MKKNRMMRLASILLICVLLTTSVIGGTFAKYVTTAESSDTARVAKWDITMGMDGTHNDAQTFVNQYDSAADASVDSDNGDDVVAPGTARSVKYVVEGTPETDYIISFEGTTASNEVYLDKGTYWYEAAATDNIDYASTMDVTVKDKYYPLEWKVTIVTENGTVSSGWTAGSDNKTYAKTYATLATAMTELAATKIEFEATEKCDVVITIAWEWDFDKDQAGDITVTGHVSNDAYDTILGDFAANNVDLRFSDDAKHSLNINYTVKMTATQID